MGKKCNKIIKSQQKCTRTLQHGQHTIRTNFAQIYIKKSGLGLQGKPLQKNDTSMLPPLMSSGVLEMHAKTSVSSNPQTK
jgi:hypothetical protein